MDTIFDHIVNNGLCCGCGMCAGVSTACGLSMQLSPFGEYLPHSGKCNGCGVCLEVCPFYDPPKPINRSMGEPIGCYIGYSQAGSERQRAASGGLVTRVLVSLLEQKLVDGVVIVGASQKPDRLFEPIVVRNAKEVIQHAGSKYYPIEFSGIIKSLTHLDGKYAIVALPCVISGFRLVQKTLPKLRNKIAYLLGLTCGHTKTTQYTSMLLSLVGASDKNLETVSYRVKDNTIRADNYGFKGFLKDNKETRQINSAGSLVQNIWCERHFALDACFKCPDTFAEQADATFMDAWLEPYLSEPKGTSIMITRNRDIDNLIVQAKNNGTVALSPITPDEVLKSQEAVVLFKEKKSPNRQRFLFNQRFSRKLGTFGAAGRLLLKYYIAVPKVFFEKYPKIKTKLRVLWNRSQ